ncbi:MAG: hypothetical protein WC428_00115 [Candidatus Paceibacterota bacterium]
MKTTLLQIFLKKEKIHWNRIKQLFGKFNGWASKLTFGVIVASLLIIVHYAMTFMHLLYEVGLFIFARDMFRANLQKLALKV